MDRNLQHYLSRFILLHVVTYWVVGSIFYQVAGYAEALETMEIFALWRPLENLLMVFVVFFGQIFRGIILALLLYPFYNTFMGQKHGWVLLFGLLFGFTALGSPIFIANGVNDLATKSAPDLLADLAIGIPEITAQMLLFSWLLVRWEGRSGGVRGVSR